MKHAEWNREVTNHDIINYQRRHRKWALEQAKYWLYWAINNIRWEHEETLKAEAEVERYKNIVKSKSPKKWEITSWIDRCNKAETDLSRQRRLRKRSIDFARFSYLKRCMAEEEVEGLILQGVQTEARAEKAEADKAKLVEALEDMVTQFAYGNAVGQLHTGGLSSLEHAFNVLGWDDPRDAGKEMLCDEPGCKKFISCGTPTASGYRNVCSEHYAALKEINP